MKLSICSAAVLLFFAHTVCCVSVVARDELYAKTGSTATLTCATGVDQENGNVTWMKGDIGSSVPVESLNDSRTSTNFNNLTISNFHHSEHVGMYYCSMEGPATEHYQLSCPTHVQHARIMANNVSIPVMTKIVSFAINSTAALECNVPPSWPLAHIYWERNGIRLDVERDPRFSLLPSGNLYIIGVIEDDQAHYRCSATNPITMATRHSKVTYQLTVTAPPSNFTAPAFTIIPVDTVAITGSRVVIECLGHAHLEPELEWINIHGRRFPKGGGVLPTGALQFDPVTSEDAGTYRCHLSNSVGITYTQITLEVKEPPSLSSAPQPRFELPVDGAIATNNSIITCSASGSAPLEVLLVHNGRVIREESLSEGIGVREIILTHSVEGEGYYQCFAKNDYGCQQWTTLATHTPSLPTTTESPTSTLGTSVEESSEPFTTSTDKPSNETTVTPGIFASTSEAVVKTETTEAPLNASSEGEPTTSQGETITTTSQEGPTMPVEGEPVTSEGPSTTCCIGEGETTTNIEEPTTQEPVSEKITTDSEPVTHPTTTGTRSMTTDTPTQPPLTTPPPPVLDIMTNGDRFSVMVGSSLTLECHVSGGGEGTLVYWFFNGDKLPNVNVEQTHDNDGMPRLSTQLTFDLVESSHAGQYMCEAHSPLHSQTVSAPIQLNVSPLLQPPLNLTVVASQDGRRLAISWLPNPLNAGHTLLGYKLVWDLPSRVVQSAVDSVRPSVREYTTYPVDLSAEYSVLVWAYNTQGDGQPAKAEWSQQSTVSTTEARSECIAMEISPTQVLLEWPDQVGVLEGVVNIIATCQSSQTSSVTQVPVATNSYTLHHLLPSCHYHFRVGVANCYVDTHPGHVDLSTRVHRYDNGSIRLNWFLPEELRELSGGRRGLTIEVRVGGATSGWVPIQPSHAPHIPTHLDTEHSIEFRLRLGDWEGYSIINIPPQTTPTSPTPTTVAMETQPEEAGGHGFQFSEIGLIYGVIFGLLVVACASVVIVILVLKYIQMTRREDDKVTNHREKHMEEFRRMSLQRSSVNSLKKDANFDQQEKKDQF